MNEDLIFGPEHVGKTVYHKYGQTGIIERIDTKADHFEQLVVTWVDQHYSCLYCLNGHAWAGGARVVFLADQAQHTTVVDQLNDIHYTPGGGANFRLTVTDGNTEHTAAVDLFEFLIWAQADGLIDGYSAEEPHKESVILPVPDEEQSHRATAQVKRLYVWLQQLPLATFTRALNERPAMWSSFDENMEPINA